MLLLQCCENLTVGDSYNVELTEHVENAKANTGAAASLRPTVVYVTDTFVTHRKLLP